MDEKSNDNSISFLLYLDYASLVAILSVHVLTTAINQLERRILERYCLNNILE